MENNLEGNPSGIRRESDGAWIPLDPANSDYQRYLRWLENPDAPENTLVGLPVPPEEG